MTETPVTRLYDAMSRGDTAAMRACCAPDVRFWHCFDGVAQDIESSVQGWEGLIAHTKARHAEDVRSIPTQDGLVQQFVFVITTPTGERKAWALCVVVKIKDGLITRVDEYIDRAGGFDVGDGDVTTPGF
jgi:ketosteroid isomerase-like protein